MNLLEVQKEVGNMNLVSTANRAVINLGEDADKIINCVELETRGASLLINAHYSALPFDSKPFNYFYIEEGAEVVKWQRTPFKNDLTKWCILAGIRTLPDEYLQIEIRDLILKEFGWHNENSICEAINMNLRGKYWETIEPFDSLNNVFLTKLMSKYEIELRRAHKRAVEIRDKLKKPVELTEEQKDAKIEMSIKELHSDHKNGLLQGIDGISSVIYDFLDKKGELSFTAEEKNESMTQGKAYLKSFSKNQKDEFTKEEIIIVAKRMLVKKYFEIN